jgi:hypothetical protein
VRLPETFNSNEWFIIVVSLFLIMLSFILKRRHLFSHIAVIFTLNFFLAASLDHILAGSHYDLYDIMDVSEFEIFDFIIYLFIYPLTGYLFIYFLDIWKEKGFSVILFLLLTSFITVGLEWIAIRFYVFEHKDWTYFHSLFAYFLIFCINATVYFWMRKRIINAREHRLSKTDNYK